MDGFTKDELAALYGPEDAMEGNTPLAAMIDPKATVRIRMTNQQQKERDKKERFNRALFHGKLPRRLIPQTNACRLGS